MNLFTAVKNLETLFKKEGFSLYFVGGSVRDYLLNLALDDIDLVTDATPNDMKRFLLDADFTFEKFGYVKTKFESFSFDITTLRKEEKYSDLRHPSKIIFTKNIKDDCVRRDFTINGLYMDTNFKVYDYVNGVNDLNKKIIKMIGNPIERLKEDPLRIIRALRFSLTYKFEIDDDLIRAIYTCKNLLESLNKDKIIQDIKKIKNSSKDEIEKVFSDFDIKKYLDMVK